MRFENDIDAVARWVRRNIGPYELQATEQEKQKLNDIAAACMSVYEPKPGDKMLIGFFPFSEIKGRADERERDADGFVFVPKGSNTAAIGIRFNILNNQHMDYTAACIGLHEVAHLRYEDHDDNFVSYLLELQYNYFRKGV